MQRVRVGLTGLAFVFLLVMLATAFLRMADDPASERAVVEPANAAAPAEPLAQLGVAPGNVPTGPIAAPAQLPRIAPAAPLLPASRAAPSGHAASTQAAPSQAPPRPSFQPSSGAAPAR